MKMDQAIKDYIEKYGETIESSGGSIDFNLRAAIDESKKLGRPLTLKEMDKYEHRTERESGGRIT
jgi:hypothetical protein